MSRARKGAEKAKAKNAPERRVTLAGRKLAKILNRTRPAMTISEFSRKARVGRVSVYRLLKGDRWQHIDVDFALALREATDGQIQIEDCASITAVSSDQTEEEPRALKRTGTSD
jgi:predicted transcriptional regulator